MVYLTPVFEAWSNHRYDAVSFDRVDPLLGGDEALARLIDAAHARGLRLIGDLTTNHTGDHHDWFLARPAGPGAASSGRSTGSAPAPRLGYAAWLDIPSLPKLDHSSAELARRLYAGPDSVVAHVARARPRRLAHRRGQHDRAARRRRPRPRRGARRCAATMRPGAAGLLAARRARPRRDARPDGSRLARDDGLRRLHPPGLVLAQRRLARPDPASGTGSTTSACPSTSRCCRRRPRSRRCGTPTARCPGRRGQSSTMHLDSHDTPALPHGHRRRHPRRHRRRRPGPRARTSSASGCR